MNRSRKWLGSFLLLGSLCPAVVFAGEYEVSATISAKDWGYESSTGVAINERGEATGYFVDDLGHTAGWFFREGNVYPIRGVMDSPYQWSEPVAVNDNGMVIGYGQYLFTRTSGQAQTQSFVWTPEGGMVELECDGVYKYSGCILSAMNNKGQITGCAYLNGSSSGFLRDADGTIHQLSGERITTSYALDINENGWVVGFGRGKYPYYPLNYMPAIAFLWKEAGGAIPLLPDGCRSSIAYKVNDAGQILLSAHCVGPRFEYFLWDEKNGMQRIPIKVEPWCNVTIAGLNNVGQALFHMNSISFDPEFNGYSVLWSGEGDEATLEYPGSIDMMGVSLNDFGEVTGVLRLPSGHKNKDPLPSAFFWTQGGGLTLPMDSGEKQSIKHASYAVDSNNSSELLVDRSIDKKGLHWETLLLAPVE